MKVLLTNICIQFGLKEDISSPVIFAGVCMGYGDGNADLRKCRESSCFRICNCYSGASRWNDEKAASRYNASVSMLSGEIVRMWIFVAAAAGSKCLSLFDKRKVENKNSVE